ncbi:MAG: tripartite tricarboxylate transporter substrate binding protein [Proteobacteria bacterium]|nr:tripartite tricarboxylate transporter substrate binding protein [Pseudomonadota bacterium]
MFRRHLRCASLLVVLGIAPAGAADWPTRALQMVVPFPAGGATDVAARAIAESMAATLGQPVVIANRDGASGTIGTGVVLSAKPDGYTVGFSPLGPISIQPHLIADLPYKPDDALGVCGVVTQQFGIAVKADGPLKTLGDLVGKAKLAPGKLSVGFGGVATVPHLALAQFEALADIKTLGVPFRGDPPVIAALRAGEIDAAMLNIGLALAQSFRLLTVVTAQRSAEIPDVPTATELGFPVVQDGTAGVFVPKGVPGAIVQRLAAACDVAVRSERFLAVVKASQQVVTYMPPDVYARYVAGDIAAKRELIRRAGIVVR